MHIYTFKHSVSRCALVYDWLITGLQSHPVRCSAILLEPYEISFWEKYSPSGWTLFLPSYNIRFLGKFPEMSLVSIASIV